MMRRSCWFAGCLGLVLALPSLARAAQLDEVIILRNDQETKLTGVVTEDSYSEVKLQPGAGMEVSQKRATVVKVTYMNADWRNLERGKQRLDEGDYAGALESLQAAAGSIGRLQPRQQGLYAQHIYYYRGMALMKLGKLDEAAEVFGQLLDKKKNTAWIFEAGYYEAKTTEQKNAMQAKNKYNLRAKDFKEIYEKERVAEAARWTALCQIAIMRLDLTDLLVGAGRDAQVKEKLAEVRRVKGNQALWALLTPADRAQVVQLEASALEYLKEYEELIGVLDSVVRDAQKDNDQESLLDLFLRRAEANYQLYKSRKDTKRADQALFDYLRLDLVYPLGSEAIGKVNYRLGELFMALKGPDHKSRAIHHLQKAKSMGKGPEAMQASNLLTEAEALPDPKPEAKPATPEKK